MQALSTNDVLQERRNFTPEKSSLWNKLSFSQKVAETKLTQFGYDLTYLRDNNTSSMAILICGDSIATVDSDGDIDTSSSVTLR